MESNFSLEGASIWIFSTLIGVLISTPFVLVCVAVFPKRSLAGWLFLFFVVVHIFPLSFLYNGVEGFNSLEYSIMALIFFVFALVCFFLLCRVFGFSGIYRSVRFLKYSREGCGRLQMWRGLWLKNYGPLLYILLGASLGSWLFFFGHSGFLDFLNGVEEPRFSFYQNPEIVQLGFVLFSRLLTVVSILAAPAKLIFPVVVVASFVGVQSVERQAVFVIFFAILVRCVVRKFGFMNLCLLLFSIYVVMAVSVMQGNFVIEFDNFMDLIYHFGLLVFNRVVLDPGIMWNLVFVEFGSLETYFLHNRVIGLVFDSDWNLSSVGILADGYLAIGLFGGAAFAGLWFGVMVFLASCSAWGLPPVLGTSVKALGFVACASFFYSNVFSVVPLVSIILLLLLRIVFWRFYLVKFRDS